MKAFTIKAGLGAILVLFFCTSTSAGLFDDLSEKLKQGLEKTLDEKFKSDKKSSEKAEDKADAEKASDAPASTAPAPKPPKAQAAAATSGSGNTQVGKMWAEARAIIVGDKLHRGEFGYQLQDYAVIIGLQDMRNTSIPCSRYIYEQFETRENRSRLFPIRDKLSSMQGQEILLQNVRKSAAGTCVFSAFRPATLADYSVNTQNRIPKDAMPPAGNRRVDKVIVMGVRLCGDIVQAGEYLETQGYKNAARAARQFRVIGAGKRLGIDNHYFNINNGGPAKKDNIYMMHFDGTFKDGPNLFESEKSRFEKDTGIKLTCERDPASAKERYTRCKYPAGEPNYSVPGFSYAIIYNEAHKSFYIDASAWGYGDCGYR